MPQIFEVGGCVRDEILGLHSDDIDFTFVLDDLTQSVDEGWDKMVDWLSNKGFKIFLQTKDCFTIRAKFPKGHQHDGLVADFVMARKEVGVIEGTRRPILELGSLDDDLVRRDFTMNAIAKDLDGNLIDLFDGMSDIDSKVIKTPLDPLTTLLDDPLRMIRAIRFSLTKGFQIDAELKSVMFDSRVISKLIEVVSQERIQVEITKMMKFDTIGSIKVLADLPQELLDIIFKGNMWLMPTTKKK